VVQYNVLIYPTYAHTAGLARSDSTISALHSSINPGQTPHQKRSELQDRFSVPIFCALLLCRTLIVPGISAGTLRVAAQSG
jgi:hypothetical protein